MLGPHALPRRLFFLLFFFIALLLSWNSGAFRAELSDNPGEPAHYVTGLMVHDYVALGHWPPFFYIGKLVGRWCSVRRGIPYCS